MKSVLLSTSIVNNDILINNKQKNRLLPAPDKI